MAATIALTLVSEAKGTYDEGNTIANRRDSIQKLVTYDADIAFVYGTGTSLLNGAVQVNDWHFAEYTINAGANLDIDLTGSTTYKNPFGTTLAFTAVKLVAVSVKSPDGAKSVRVGPQNASNAFQGWHGGVGASNYDTVFTSARHVHMLAGWTVAAGTGDILRINNPGGSAVTIRVLIAGVK